jgi:hypothetical protein
MKPIDEVVMVDCAMQVKKFYNLYLDADFDDKLDLALFYKSKMEHFQSLVDQGVEHEPNF